MLSIGKFKTGLYSGCDTVPIDSSHIGFIEKEQQLEQKDVFFLICHLTVE